MFTAHSPVVFASKAGYAKGFAPNELLRRLKETFPLTTFDILSVQCSRPPEPLGGELDGKEDKLDEEEREQLAMRRKTGSGYRRIMPLYLLISVRCSCTLNTPF
eukprot:GILI01070130.1.p2 GENE.GILI01070130.1~~GILI01070130.1.p2  ORF type:complete len:104 (-),score=4.18 GILI01070130.1:23-334(-)